MGLVAADQQPTPTISGEIVLQKPEHGFCKTEWLNIVGVLSADGGRKKKEKEGKNTREKTHATQNSLLRV